ncbi:hypothetical protein HYQ46_004941 [Verticillium longisporum]|nr:hypothetical protein HYQ46_004941 [Verticillium longisporum]
MASPLPLSDLGGVVPGSTALVAGSGVEMPIVETGGLLWNNTKMIWAALFLGGNQLFCEAEGQSEDWASGYVR